MQQLKKTHLHVIVLICTLTLSGCLEKDLYKEPGTPKVEDYFNYTTSLSCQAEIDYGFKNYMIFFELFEENPMIEMPDGSYVKSQQEPLYRGSTDKNGKFMAEISLPNYLTELYLYSDFIGTINPVRLPIINGKISFDQSTLKKANQVNAKTTRASTSGGRTYPDNMLALGNWSTFGRPDYLSTFFIEEIEAQLLYNIRSVFIKPGGAASMFEMHPEYVADDVNMEINIIKPTKISLVMLHSTASMQNTVGYFTYPTGQKPTAESIKPIIAYPHISSKICNANAPGALYTGDKVDLKYWDGEKFVDEFPANTSIGWYMIQTSYNTTTGAVNSKNQKQFYSLRDLNVDRAHRTIALKDENGKIVAFGFEDANNFYEPSKQPSQNSKYGNFGDAVFYLEFDKSGDIDTEGVPDLPKDDITQSDIFVTYSGQLAFEDQWPGQGDYDMNDVIVTYKRMVYKSVLTQKASKLIDTFTPAHNGALKKNGFGYQLTGIPASSIKNISIESDGVAPSQFMQGSTQEPGQDYPTIILFDNLSNVLGKTFTVTIDLAPEVYQEQQVTPFTTNNSFQAYWHNMNPFIIIDSDKERGKEAHIVKFPPTSKANVSYFGTLNDRSQPEEKLYYVSQDNLPTGLQLSNVNIGTTKGKEFIIPKEKYSILDMYPSFYTWATSFGAKETKWWTKPSAE